MSRDRIETLRQRVKSLDLALLEKVNQRAALCLEIGALKRADELPVHDPEQERSVLAYLRKENPGPLGWHPVREIFGTIVAACRRLQEDPDRQGVKEGPTPRQRPLPTAVYCVLGSPVAQSMGPVMHGAAFRHLDLDAVYVPFEVEDLPGAVAGLKRLGCKGASITHPFKEAVMACIDDVDETAQRIGAVNTLVMTENGISGKNTDWLGVVRTIEDLLPVSGRTFAVLGAGGAARAAVFGITKQGGNAVVINRSETRGRALAAEFDSSFAPPSQIEEIHADCLVNTTPVGMYPHVDETPLAGEALRGFEAVVDVIYNPLETRLLREARSQGCLTASGLDMFVHQGAEQLRLWTGMDPPVGIMRDCVHQRLAHDTQLLPAKKK